VRTIPPRVCARHRSQGDREGGHLDHHSAGEISDSVDSGLVGSWLHIDSLRTPEELTSCSPRPALSR